MSDVLDSASLIDAAQEAIVVGDYSKAERLLRDAAAAQEASLGPEHPELARTLHDYAFICERTNNLAAAEQSYRRAHAIAVKTLSPRDPFVFTSVKNLVNFCAAHTIPIWTPPASGPLSESANHSPAEPSALDLYASEAGTPKSQERPRVTGRTTLAEQNRVAEPSLPLVEPGPVEPALFERPAYDLGTESVPSEEVPTKELPIEAAPTQAVAMETAAFDVPIDAVPTETPKPATPEPDPFRGDVFDPAPRETTSFEGAPIEHAPLQTASSKAPAFAADPFDTSAVSVPAERYATLDPVVPSAVPVDVLKPTVRRSSDLTGRVIALLVGAAVVIVAVPLALRWSGSAFPVATPEPPAVAQPSAPAAPPATTATSDTAPTRVQPSPTPSAAAAPSKPAPAERVEPPATVAPPTPRTVDAAAPQVTVLKARLCRTISKQGSPDWQCTPAEGDDLRPGNYFFYTRLLATANTKVEHRWYRDNREHKVITLSITASPGVGYRTISSTNIGADRVGDWRVELRAADGTLLQEERFSIHK